MGMLIVASFKLYLPLSRPSRRLSDCRITSIWITWWQRERERERNLILLIQLVSVCVIAAVSLLPLVAFCSECYRSRTGTEISFLLLSLLISFPSGTIQLNACREKHSLIQTWVSSIQSASFRSFEYRTHASSPRILNRGSVEGRLWSVLKWIALQRG